MYRISKNEKLILASTSPRRRELLLGFGLEFEIIPPDCDETPNSTESPQALVQRLALLKAQSVAKSRLSEWVVGADTVVAIDGEILGKPNDKNEAIRMLQKIAGRQHQVWGGLALVNESKVVSHVESHLSQVTMGKMSDSLIEAYVNSGEPMDKAGSYAIQGIGAGLVCEVQGSYTNVVGLNLAALFELLRINKVIELK